MLGKSSFGIRVSKDGGKSEKGKAWFSLASCENETQHKHKEIWNVWPIKARVPDSPRLSI